MPPKPLPEFVQDHRWELEEELGDDGWEEVEEKGGKGEENSGEEVEDLADEMERSDSPTLSYSRSISPDDIFDLDDIGGDTSSPWE